MGLSWRSQAAPLQSGGLPAQRPCLLIAWPESTQGLLLPSSGDTRQCVCPRQCPCLLLSLLGQQPGNQFQCYAWRRSSTNMQTQQKRCPVGKKAASLYPLQHSQKHGKALSKGRGRRKQQEVFGNWVNLEGTSSICITELMQDLDAQTPTAIATGMHQAVCSENSCEPQPARAPCRGAAASLAAWYPI